MLLVETGLHSHLLPALVHRIVFELEAFLFSAPCNLLMMNTRTCSMITCCSVITTLLLTVPLFFYGNILFIYIFTFIYDDETTLPHSCFTLKASQEFK